MKLKSIFEMWSWTTAVRFNSDERTSLLNNKTDAFTVVPNSKRYWTADPFLFEKDGVLYLFFEAFDIFKRKGLLGYRTLSEGEFGDIHIFYEHDSHLSFPFIYEENGEIYVMPESAKSGELFRLRCKHFPDQWEKEAVLLKENVVDTVRYVDGDNVYYISELVTEPNVYDRVDLYYLQDGSLLPCAHNPVKADASNARGAGAVCVIDGVRVRPAQDCGDSYGERLNLNELMRIDREHFEERTIDTFTYRDIRLNESITVDGIHTYNKLGKVEVIDLRIPGKFNLLYTVGFINKIFAKLFH
ncbi:MAG: hypothetical protein IJ168_11175 [Eubacterium sp.]|nr:hypothetical protein [Eubacterium sp.]